MTVIIVTLQPHKLTTKMVHEPSARKSKLPKDSDSVNGEDTSNGDEIANGDEAKNGDEANPLSNGTSNGSLVNGKECEQSVDSVSVNGNENSKSSDLKRPIESSV